MAAILFKIWYLLVIFPMYIAQEGWARLSKFLDKRKYNRKEVYDKGLYFALAVLVLLLLILVLLGY